jgi:hypothetical protein
LIVAFVIIVSHAHATSYTAMQSGNWNANSTWGGSGYPQAGDDANLSNGFTITLTAAAACTNINSGSGSSLSLGSNNLTITGNFTSNCNSVTITSSGGYIVFNGTSQTVTLSCSLTIPNVRLSNSTAVSMGTQNNFIVTGNFDCQTGSSTFTNNNASGWPSGYFQVTGTCTAPNCTFVAGTNINGTSMDFSSCTSNPIQVGSVTVSQSTANVLFGSKNVNTTSAFSGTNTGNISHSGTITVIGSSTITLGSSTLNGFAYCVGSGPSTYQSYTVTGTYLTANIVLTAPTHYEISTASGSGYTNTITLTQSGGNVASTTIYVRLKSAYSAASYNSETISHASTGATTVNVTCSGAVNALPTVSISPSATTICNGTGSTLTASGASTYAWSNSLGTGSSKIVSPSSNTTYTVSGTDANNCINTASQAITVTALPAAPTGTAAQSFCSGAGPLVSNLVATGTAILWYAASSGGSSLSTSASLSNATHYYASQTVSSCEGSSRFDVTATVNTTPTVSGNTPASRCGTGTVGLAATPSAGIINWYAASSGGSSLGTGNNYTTPSISTTTTYYVDATNNSCTTTSRTSITATVNAIPSASGTVSGTATVVQGQTGVSYSVSAISGATGYTWSLPSNASITAGSNTNAITVTFASNATSGNVSVYGTNACGNGTVSSNFAVTVAPLLTAASSPTVDAAFDVTFTDDATWRGLISGITIGGTTLTSGWAKSAGKITFTPSASSPASLLQSSGSKSIVIQATGYANTTVTQAIGVGGASKLAMSTQPAAPASNGIVLGTQPVVLIQDQYGNTTASTATVVAAATSSLWTIAGTTSKAGVSGTATFTDLTAGYTSSVSGATITFTSTGLTSVNSGSFNIPAPPSITLASTSQTVSGNISKNSTQNILSAFTFAVTSANAQISSLQFSTTGTYIATDVSKFQLWYATSNSIGSATQIGSDISTSLGTGTHTFSGLSQSISSGATGYFWITTNVASGATTSATITVSSIATTDVTFIAGSKSGSITAAGTKTIVASPIDYYFINGSGNWNTASNWLIGSTSGSASSVIPSVNDNVFIQNGWGNTVTIDIANAYCNNLTIDAGCILSLNGNALTANGNMVIASSNQGTITVGSGALNILGNVTINENNGGNLNWDAGSVTIGGNFIDNGGWGGIAGSEAGYFVFNGATFTNSEDHTFPYFRQNASSFTKAGANVLTILNTFDRNCGSAPSVSAGSFAVSGSTINATCGTPSVALSSANPSVAAANIALSSTKNSIYAFTLAITTNNATLNQLNFSTTNTAADITKYQLWYNSSNNLTTATQVGTDITTSLGTGSHSFLSLTQTLTVNTTCYFWITTDIAGAATLAHTIAVSAITTSNITLASGTESGTAYAGGSQTIVVAPTVTVSTATLTGFTYLGSGPSPSQSFTVSGSNLIGYPANITVTAPTDYEVCLTSGGTFAGSVNVAYSSATLSATAVYVRLKSGKTAGASYNSENVSNAASGATSVTVACSGTVGQTYFYIGGNPSNWSAANNWSTGCGQGSCSCTPTANDSIIIGCGLEWYNNNNSRWLVIDQNVTVKGFSIVNLMQVSISGTNTLTVNGNLTIGNTSSWNIPAQGLLNVGSGNLNVSGNLSLGYNNDTHGLRWDDGTITVGGNLICSDAGNLDANQADGTNKTNRLGGDANSNPLPSPVPTYAGSLIMNGTNKTIEVDYSVDIPNLKLASSTITKTGSATLYVDGTMNFNNQTAFDNQAGSLQLTGSISNASSTVISNEASLMVSATTDNIASISAPVASNTVTYFTAGGSEPVIPGTYYNLIITGGGTKALGGDITINNTLGFSTAGFVDLSGHTLTMNNWANGNIQNLATDRYIISDNGVFTINGVNSGETATFPIGLSSASSDYCRVDVANSDAAHTSFSVTGVCNSIYQNGTCSASGTTAKNSKWIKYTWFISSLSTNAAVTLYWDASKELTGFDRTNTQINHFNGTTWEKKGVSGAASNLSGSIYYYTASTNSFSPYGGGDDGSLLPIELSTFKVKKSGNDNVKIDWSTETETNNDYFTLEKSIDGETWQSIYSCQGAGTSTIAHIYSFIDDEPYYGINYYRLKQTDIDGEFTYTTVESVEIKNDNITFLVYPNPAKLEDINIIIKGYKSENATVSIIDATGMQLCSGVVEVSNNPIIIKLSDICIVYPGTYFISITGKDSVLRKKIIVR